jgi:PAS domain S-box-containing protein
MIGDILQFAAGTPDSAALYGVTYAPSLVALSVLLAVTSAWIAFLVADFAAQYLTKWLRFQMVGLSGVAMGGSIWTMHFVGMLALQLPCGVTYNFWPSLLSILPGMLVSGYAVSFISNPSPSARQILLSGALFGIAIGTMHYAGMAAMQFAGHIEYDPYLFGLSVVVAFALVTLALWVRFRVAPRLSTSTAMATAIAAIFMGLATSGTHYLGIWATYFVRNADRASPATGFGKEALAVDVTAVAVMLSVIAGLAVTRAVTENARARIAQVLSGLPAAVYRSTIDADGRVISFTINRTVQRLTGWTVDDVRDRTLWEGRARETERRDWDEFYLSIVRDGEAIFEYAFERQDGRSCYLREQARVIETVGEGRYFVVGYVSDITRERRIQTQAMASAQLATLGEMATGLAHELNQPIATASVAAEIAAHALAKQGANGIDIALDRMGRIVKQAARARTIIDHLRIFGRQSADDLGPVDLKKAVEGALVLVGNTLRSAGIEVQVSMPEGMKPAMAQLVLAEHVVVNLLVNARDAMEGNPPESPRLISITIDPIDAGAGLVLAIGDSGPGIPDAVLERIFQPFFTTKEVGKGTGLGLSFCHGVMASFGGGISVRNQPGGGAVFEARFRCASAAELAKKVA